MTATKKSTKVSVIGAAGYVGSNIASILALNKLGDELVLVDPPKANIATHLAMDVGTAASENDVTVSSGGYETIAGSDIVIISAGAIHGLMVSRMDVLPLNLPIIREIALEIKKSCPDAIVITATNPVDPLNYAMYRLTGFDRRKILGYSFNDSLRFRMMVAQALGHNGSDVNGFVIGEHGESQVLLFSSVKIKGKSVTVSDAARQKVRAMIPEILRRYEELRTGRTTGVTSAAGMKKVVGAILNNAQEDFTLSVVLDGEYGLNNVSMGVPVVLGRDGVTRVQEIRLAKDEQLDLENTKSVLQTAMQQVDAFIAAKK